MPCAKDNTHSLHVFNAFVLISGLSKADLKLDLRKLTEELIYAVPHKKEEIVPLINNTADIFWERRRYGESWEEVEIPSSYYSAEDQGADMESRSKKVSHGSQLSQF